MVVRVKRCVGISCPAKGVRRSTKQFACASTQVQELRALSVCCTDLAVAILAKQKRVENRTRAIPKHSRHKWIALHVSFGQGGPVKAAKLYVRNNWNGAKSRNTPWSSWTPSTKQWARSNGKKLLPNSAIVGLVRLSDSHPLAPGEQRKNPWALGPHCWRIKDAVPLKPPVVGLKGTTGLWNVCRMNPNMRRSDCSRLQKLLQQVHRRKS